MSRPSFLNENRNRAYPFVYGTVDDKSSTLRGLSNNVIADVGFVMGVDSGFEATDSVYLYKIERSGSTFTFYFGTSASSLSGSYLIFTRTLSDPDYLSEQVDSEATHAGSWSAEDCDEPLWSGFMVSGRISSLEEILPVDGELVRTGDTATVEPALVHNLSGSYVKMFALANSDRTRVDSAEDCDEIEWPYDVGIIHVNARCLQDDVLIMPGFNCTVRQDSQANTMTLGAGVGAGEGEPCTEVPLFSGESAPDSSTLLTGGPDCNEVLRSFNGVGGRLFNFLAGRGVDITPEPGSNKIIIDINLAGLSGCATDEGSVVSVSEQL